MANRAIPRANSRLAFAYGGMCIDLCRHNEFFAISPPASISTKKLFQAVVDRDFNSVLSQIEQRADVSAANMSGWTPLAVAANLGDTDLVKLILAAGAEVDTVSEFRGTALMEAASYGHIDVIDVLLDAGADANKQNWQGWTALMVASLFDYTKTISRLIGAKADVNIRNDEHLTALMIAIKHGSANAIHFLINAGTDYVKSEPNVSCRPLTRWEPGHPDKSAESNSLAASKIMNKNPRCFCCSNLALLGWKTVDKPPPPKN